MAIGSVMSRLRPSKIFKGKKKLLKIFSAKLPYTKVNLPRLREGEIDLKRLKNFNNWDYFNQEKTKSRKKMATSFSTTRKAFKTKKKFC